MVPQRISRGGQYDLVEGVAGVRPEQDIRETGLSISAMGDDQTMVCAGALEHRQYTAKDHLTDAVLQNA